MKNKSVNRAKTASLAAPIGGWNAKQALGEMSPSDAVFMTNWYPSTSDVIMREGYSSYATGLGSQVESLIPYAGTSTDKLFAAAGTNVYDITSAGAVGAAVRTAMVNARFQSTNVATAGGNFLLMVNGAVKLQGYNGSAWYSDGDGSHDITVVDTASCDQIFLFKNRVWLIQSASLNAWYLPTSAISGAAVAFPLKGVARDGGYIVAMGAWTIDAGYGVDDLAVFVTNKGEVIVYQGTDPASASTWALVGIWKLGAPIGRRCLLKYKGDLIYLCEDGLVPMSAGLQSSRLDPRVSLTDKIQFAVSQAVQAYGANFGWDLTYFPGANLLFINVPISVGSQQQYVMNTITGSWCNFTGWNANCFVLYDDNIYFGGNGFVAKAWDGLDDDGTNISADCQQAFTYFDQRGILKRFTMIRPILLTNGNPAVVTGINIDYDDTPPTGSFAFSPITLAEWDVALWDAANWTGGLAVSKQWQGVNGVGYAAAVRMLAVASGIETHWVSTDVVFESGGVL